MPTVDVRFTALPAHVRTARLVALAVARRAGVAEEVLDEIRLAVGEACSRAVGVHVKHAPNEPVTMRLSDDNNCFTVEVIDAGTLEGDEQDAAFDPLDAAALAAADANESVPASFGLAVIGGLVEEVAISSENGATQVRMAWPASPA
ncbi:MAG: ATP-binding protein [Frankiaceae bacterium]|nr:ATP-binding protein [Frankiaceae bacterium]